MLISGVGRHLSLIVDKLGSSHDDSRDELTVELQ